MYNHSESELTWEPSINFQKWSLIIRCSLVEYQGVVLPLTVSVFLSCVDRLDLQGIQVSVNYFLGQQYTSSQRFFFVFRSEGLEKYEWSSHNTCNPTHLKFHESCHKKSLIFSLFCFFFFLDEIACCMAFYSLRFRLSEDPVLKFNTWN